MIPKVINYCWFGGNPLPQEALDCIESWKKYFPDYKIIQWNENNFDVSSCRYSREAYDAKKWAFVSDYARTKILYENGGIYLDTDVKVIKSYDDLLNNGPFMGVEYAYGRSSINSGLGSAAEPRMEIYREILDFYESRGFDYERVLDEDETCVRIATDIFVKYGYVRDNSLQKIKGVTIYPSDYLCPMDYLTGKVNITDNTVSIHEYAGTWLEKESLFVRAKRKIRRIVKKFK